MERRNHPIICEIANTDDGSFIVFVGVANFEKAEDAEAFANTLYKPFQQAVAKFFIGEDGSTGTIVEVVGPQSIN